MKLRKGEKQSNKYKPASAPADPNKRNITIAMAAVLVVVTFIAFAPSLQNGFTNWDDDVLLTQNPQVRDASPSALIKLLRSKTASTYIPLTIISFAVQYHFVKLQPGPYHAANLFFHILTVLAVFWFCYLLCNNLWVAFLAALFFGVHPLRVESVAWVTERKDVLYVFFFMASLIGYLLYRKTGKISVYVLSILLFLLSCLAKGVAVVLPLILVLIDYFQRRKFDRKAWLEKIPYLAISLGIGFIAYLLQGHTRMIQIGPQILFPNNVLVGCYSILFYLFKTVLPVQLSALYPYPEGFPNTVPFYLYLALAAVAILAGVLVTRRKRWRTAIFGLSFMLIASLPVLGFIPMIGPAITADRYVYLGSVGLMFIFSLGAAWLHKKRKDLVWLGIALLGFLALILVVLTSARCRVWKSSETMWTDVLKHHPRVQYAYNSRGQYYYEDKKYDQALEDFSRAVEIGPKYAKAWYNRGNVFDETGVFDRAIDDYTRAIGIEPHYTMAYNNRGLAHRHKGDFEKAIADFTAALGLDPNYAKAYNNRGMVLAQTGEHPRAIDDFTRAIRIDPRDQAAYFNRAVSYYQTGELERSRADVAILQRMGVKVNEQFLDLLRKADLKK
jgi:tetratricopeptide (TPR) repeat protein